MSNPITELKVEVFSASYEERSGTSQSGRPYEIFSQKAYIHIHDNPYPIEFKINLQKDSHGQVNPYVPGIYYLDSSSIYVNPRYSDLQIRPILVLKEKSKSVTS
jgi:hypothetical protein